MEFEITKIEVKAKIRKIDVTPIIMTNDKGYKFAARPVVGGGEGLVQRGIRQNNLLNASPIIRQYIEIRKIKNACTS